MGARREWEGGGSRRVKGTEDGGTEDGRNMIDVMGERTKWEGK